MGIYLNPDNQAFSEFIRSDIYVDKTGLLKYMNGQIGKAKHLVASSRPRRFGKSLAVQMMAAYYSRGCDSRELFSKLEIAKEETFEKYLNKYDVIALDIQWMKGIAVERVRCKQADSILGCMQMEVVKELRKEYPEYVSDDETLIASALSSINNATKKQFVILIDEWDCFFREDKEDESLQKQYIVFLRSLFKGRPADEFVKLAYITGILPIKKYGTQSALNNFREFTMIAPDGIAKYIGFTEADVRKLCKENAVSFREMKKWYDGYLLNKTSHAYNPNSVMEAIDRREFQNYWSKTETYEALRVYIEMNFDGLKQKIVNMLNGERCKADVELFQNDMTTFDSSDDVLTLLVHLGYLGYDEKTKEVFIPNEEIRGIFLQSIKNEKWAEVYKAIVASEELLAATLAMDGAKVAGMIQKVHMQTTSSLVYNNEVSLASVILLAYYTAAKDYTLIREFPAGDGFADMVFLPKRASAKPALVVELKWDKSAEGALWQIKNKKYVEALEDYKGNILLVGIDYDKKNRRHECRIEKEIL